MKKTKVIVRIRGGLGNQLFCYAAARRLALVSNAELAIDDVTGFIRDHQYNRKYLLDNFLIPVRKATSWERMEPFERCRRGVAKLIAGHQSFHERRYVEEGGIYFDPRLLEFHPKRTVYIDGLWQSERYFKDVEEVIRQDLRIIPPPDAANRHMARKIRECNSICVHIRCYSNQSSVSNLDISKSYYSCAVDYIFERVPMPHFFIFSDNPDVACTKLSLPKGMFTYMTHNLSVGSAYADLWLMSQCKHFIIANSTFSWWGAWLAESYPKIVAAPDVDLTEVAGWDFLGLIPGNWVLLPTNNICHIG